MDQYPSNSRNNVNRPEEKKDTDPEYPRLEKVVTGKVIRRKKSLGRRLRENLFGGDGLSGYLLHEVLVPAMKDMIATLCREGVERAVYGEVRTTRTASYRGGSTGRPHTNYTRPSMVVSNGGRSDVVRRSRVNQPSAFDVHDIILESKIEAQRVIDKMYETVDRYGCVTVAALNDLLEQTSGYTDHKYGWTNLDDLTARRVAEGYLLMFPDPEDLR